MGDEKTASQAEMFGNRLRKRQRHLKKWAHRRETDVYRLYDRDIPEIPLVLDRYGDAVSGALYQRPYERGEAEEEGWLRVMKAAAAGALDIPEEHIFIKQRRRMRGRRQGLAQYHKMGENSFVREVREGGLRFRVNLSDYLDTGLFPDRRQLRSLAASESAGKRVLNLFCYTAAFSVYAAAGEAASVDSVDLSNTYLDWGAANFRLNGFQAGRTSFPFPAGTGSRYRLIRADVFPFLAAAGAAGFSWDRIILDPPAFSNSKKMRSPLDLRRDHQELITRCLALLNPGGKLYFSANPRHFKLNPADFPGAAIQDISARMGDEDFRGRKIPLCFTFQI
jgi:23S rRNA G2069 N7-methylase RlmK/C1962 C5-methylase RlmI